MFSLILMARGWKHEVAGLGWFFWPTFAHISQCLQIFANIGQENPATSDPAKSAGP